MKLTTKGKFAVTAILDIALHGTDNVSNSIAVSLKSIAARQDISLSYLEQLFVKLRRRGIVKSYKGPGGGYVLARPASKINLLEIISAVDDSLDARSCMGGADTCRNNKDKSTKCLTHNLWHGLTQHINGYLQQTTLSDLVKHNKYAIETIPHDTIQLT